MKKTKHLIILLMVIGFITLNFNVTEASATVKIGDYVQLGSYYEEPILWKVINIDEEGNPLLFSDKVISLKAFDSRGSKHEYEDRIASGSNGWEFSNIRQWLNSSDDKIPWIKNEPSEDNVFVGRNAYDKEKGFLSNSNFSDSEKMLIKPVTHKVLLAGPDNRKAEGGIDTYMQSYDIESAALNYGNFYYMNIKDSVFLLSVKELKEYIHDRNWSEYAETTKKAIENSHDDYKNSSIAGYDYWLRTPIGSQMVVTNVIGACEAYSINGVRPALYINLALTSSQSGLGTSENPYIFTGNSATVKEEKFKIGNYIEFASYNDKPILWRVINIDEEGNPLLFSEDVLSIKAFDVKGSIHNDEDRKALGSNEWEFSNIRQWLNSDEQKIKWIQNPPISEGMFIDGKELITPNAYDLEKGFLAEGNFTSKERELIKIHTNKTMLSDFDSSKKDGGSELYTTDTGVFNVVKNYDKAYYKNTDDKAFLLSVKEIKEFIYDRGWEIQGKLTSEAIKNSYYMDINDDGSFWNYFLRTPNTESKYYVRSVSYKEEISQSSTAQSESGIRPALYLNINSLDIANGIGNKENPFKIVK